MADHHNEQTSGRKGILLLITLLALAVAGGFYFIGGKQIFRPATEDIALSSHAEAGNELGSLTKPNAEAESPQTPTAEQGFEKEDLQGIPVANSTPDPSPVITEQPETPPAADEIALPTDVEVSNALAAALDGSPEGRATVQLYFDRASGDAGALLKRGEKLVSALGSRLESSEPVDDILVPIQSISDALDTAAESVYVVPAILHPNHAAQESSESWDIGPAGKAAFANFQRLGADDSAHNAGVEIVDNGSESLLLNDGLTGLSTLSVSGKQGQRQVIILSTGIHQSGVADRPFIDGLSAEGRNFRTVWLDDITAPIADSGAQWLEMSKDGLTHHQWADIAVPESETGEQKPVQMAYAAILPAVPVIGNLELKFHQAGGPKPIINGLIVNNTQVPKVVDTVKRNLWDLYSPPIIAVLPEIDVEDRPTLGSVTVTQAITGATNGDKDGLDTLQAFMDATAGNLDELRLRAEALLSALKGGNFAKDLVTATDTARRILDSAISAARSGYVLPAYISPDFELNADQIGWDFGRREDVPFKDFDRIGHDSTLITGFDLGVLEELNDEPVTNDALTGVNGFYPTLKDGPYRLFLLAPANFKGQTIARPFGTVVKFGGTSLQMEDLRHADPPIWARFSIDGFSIHDGADDITQYLPTIPNQPRVASSNAVQPNRLGNGSAIPEPQSMVMSARGIVEGGRLRLEFEIPETERTIISAVIAEESDLTQFEEYIENRFAQILIELETAAAGPNNTQAFVQGPIGSPNAGGNAGGGNAGGGISVSTPGGGFGTTPPPGNGGTPTPPDPVDPPVDPGDPPPPTDPIDPPIDDTIVITPDAGGPYTVFVGDTVTFAGSAEFNVDPELLSVDWILNVDGEEIFLASGLASDTDIFTPEILANLPPGTFELILRLTFLDMIEEARTLLTVLAQTTVAEPPIFLLLFLGLIGLLFARTRIKSAE